MKYFEYKLNGKERTYRPDIYVNHWDTFVETKGFFSENDKIKMKIVKETYPNIKFEIFDTKKLKEFGIYEIDKKLGINILDYVYTRKKDDNEAKEVIKKIDRESLLDDFLIEKINRTNLAKNYGIRQTVMCRLIDNLLPKKWSKEFYEIILDRYADKNKIKYELKKGFGIKKVAKILDNRLAFKTRYKLVDLVKSSL